MFCESMAGPVHNTSTFLQLRAEDALSFPALRATLTFLTAANTSRHWTLPATWYLSPAKSCAQVHVYVAIASIKAEVVPRSTSSSPGRGKIFLSSMSSGPVLGPNQHIRGVTGTFRRGGVERPGRETDHTCN
jgi:hypothetical protein